MNYNTLEDYYQLLFALEFHHKYPTSEVENWIVFERDIKVDMIHQYLEYKKQKDQLEAKE